MTITDLLSDWHEKIKNGVIIPQLVALDHIVKSVFLAKAGKLGSFKPLVAKDNDRRKKTLPEQTGRNIYSNPGNSRI